MNFRNKFDNDEYYIWLVDRISGTSKDDQKVVENHYLMLWKLYERRFYPAIPRDDNRASDGKQLRMLYLEECDNFDLPVPDDDCRVLEMLVALAMRVERDIMHIDEYGDRSYIWFWTMVGNLGLVGPPCTDDDLYMDYTVFTEIDHIIDVFLDRQYKENGEGGLFPLKDPKRDQRDVELWYQIQEFIEENGMS